MNYILNIEFRDRDNINITLNSFKHYHLKELIGSGTCGLVYSAINTLNSKFYAIKLQNLYVNKADFINIDNYNIVRHNIYQEFDTEVNITKLFNSYNIGPKFYDTWINNDLEIGIIVTELWDSNLEYYDLSILSENIIKKLRSQIELIHNIGYIHYDIKKQNILINFNDDNEIIDITITDYGLTEKINENPRVSFKIFYDYHYKYAPSFYSQLTVSDIEKIPILVDYGLLYEIELCNKNVQIGKYPKNLIGVKEL